MKNILLLIFFISNVFVQDLPYDKAKVTNEKELNFLVTDKRGIKYKGVVYYVENDLNTVTAYRKDKIEWKSSLLGVIEPAVGKPEIRYMEIDGKKLHIVYAKHDYFDIDIKTGKLNYFGSD